MNICVLNCGSSSVKAALIDTLNQKTILEMQVERIRQEPVFNGPGESTVLQSGKTYTFYFNYPMERIKATEWADSI